MAADATTDKRYIFLTNNFRLAARTIAIAAIQIRGARILTSERLEVLVRHPRPIRHDGLLIHQLRPVDMAVGVPVDETIERVLRILPGDPPRARSARAPGPDAFNDALLMYLRLTGAGR